MNTMYPIFLKVEQLQILLVGGGFVALEKLQFLLKSSPNARVTLVAPMIRDAVRELAQGHQVDLIERPYQPSDLDGRHLVIATTDQPEINRQICEDARRRHLLINVADTPALCDFYLGGVVTKGHLKLGISTNGQSPTTAKRLRQFFEDILPDDISQLLEKLNAYRKTLRLTFEEKVERMNEVTQGLLAESKPLSDSTKPFSNLTGIDS